MTVTHSTQEQEATDRSRESDLRGLYGELKLAIEYRPVESLSPYATNPRKHSRRQLKVLTESIAAFGFVAPVIVDEDDTIIGGHGVLLAAKELGYAEVPVVRLTHLGEAEKKAIRIALNRSAELAGWDHKLLALEFSTLLNIDTSTPSFKFDLSLTGFSLPEIDRITDEGGAEEEADRLAQEPDWREPPVSRFGDIWVLDEHRLINGDARDPATYAALLGDERAAVGLHDVPYNCRTNDISKSKRHPDFIFAQGESSEGEFTAFLTEFLRQAKAHSTPGAVTFAFIDWRHMGEMLTAGRSAGLGLCDVCIWDKGSGAQGLLYRSQHEMVFVFADPGAPILNNVQGGKFGRNRTNVWSWPGARSRRQEHAFPPTPKPVGLLAEAIGDVSNRGDIVLDSFSRSGSTMIAAAKTGRRGFAVELDPHYVDVGVLRWQEWSGGIARHADTGLTFEEVKAVRRAEASSEGRIAAPGHHSEAMVPARVRQRVRRVQGTGGGK